MGSHAHEAVAAYGAPVGAYSSHQRGLISLGERGSCLGCGRCLWEAYRGRKLPSARVHQLGGRGVMPERQPLPMEHLHGTCAPLSAGPLANGTGMPAEEAVTAFGAHTKDGSPHRRGFTRGGGGESCPGGRCGL